MRTFYALLLLASAAIPVPAQEFQVVPGFIVVAAPKPSPPPAPKPAPTWTPRQNGWHQSTITGHYWHAYWGHRDAAFDWAGWYPSAQEMADCNAWLKDHGHPELPNQHFPAYQPPAPAWLKQQQYTQPMMMPSYQMKARPMMKFGRGG